MKEITVIHHYNVRDLWEYDEISYEVPIEFTKEEINAFVNQKNLELIESKISNYYQIENI